MGTSAASTSPQRRTAISLPGLMPFFMLLSLVLVAPSHAARYQSPAYWAKTYGGSGSEDPSAVLQTADGGFLLAGGTSSFGAGGDDVWIVKFNPTGGIQWQKAYGGDASDAAIAVEQTTDGGYIVAGYTGLYATGGSADFWVLKLDAAGNIEWENAYGGASMDWAFAVQQTQDGGYIVGGYSQSFGDAVGNLLVLKLAPDGSVEWQNEYGPEGSTERRVEDIRETVAGGYILASSISGGMLTTSAIWVVQLDEFGEIQWHRVFADASGAFLDTEGIQPTSDGGYVVLGEYGLNSDFLVLKLNAAGDIDWQYAIGGAASTDPESIEQTSDDGYLLSGATASFGAGDEDGWVLKLDRDGAIEWEKAYGGLREDRINDVISVSDGGYLAVGNTDSFGAGELDVLVLKVDKDGNLGCCLFGFWAADSEATIRVTSVEPIDTLDGIPVASLWQPVSVSQRETDPTTTATDAVNRRQCYFQIVDPDRGIAECLSASARSRMYANFLVVLGLAALGFFGYRWLRADR